MAQVTPVTPSIPAAPALGCGSPRAEIWTRGLDDLVLDLPDIIGVEWSRVLSDTSTASVEVAVACCAAPLSVRPWIHELVIYRDDALAWAGPITEIVVGGETLTFKARDLSAWLDHRFVHETRIYGGEGVGQGSVDTTTIFTDLVTDAMSPDTSPNLALDLDIISGVLAQGSYTPASFKTVGPLIRELAKGSIDWYVIDRTLWYSGAGASATGGGGTGGGGGSSPTDVTGASFANPGFESNTAGWSASAPSTITRDTGQFHAGAASALIDIGSSTAIQTITFATVNNLIIGKSYTLKGWVRGTGAIASPYASNFAKFNIAGVSSTNFAYLIWNATPTTTWYQISVTFTASAASHDFTVTARENHAANFYIDDFTLTINNPDEPPPPPPPPPPPDTPTTPVSLLHLSDDDLVTPARITLSGLNQETRSVVTGQQAGGDVALYGEAPAPVWALNTLGPGLTAKQLLYGLLETSVTSTLSDESGAQSQATQRAGLLTDTPVILEGFDLARTAGVRIQELVPGALVAVRLDRPCLSVEQTMLMRLVQVKATPTDEQVSLTLEPTATAEV